jgi:hypothetical protein
VSSHQFLRPFAIKFFDIKILLGTPEADAANSLILNKSPVRLLRIGKV